MAEKSRGGRRPAWTQDWFTLTGVAAAVAVVIITAYALVVSITREDAPDLSSTPYVPPASTEPLKVSILGDAFTAGFGADRGKAWPNVLTRQMCWQSNINGQSGTGYVAEGVREEYSPFGDRTAEVTDSRPAVIIVQGSTADQGRPGVREAADRVFADLRSKAPGARIIAVGPTIPPTAVPELLREVRNEVRDAAAANDVDFVDPIELGWLPDRAAYAADGINPGNDGAAAYATSVRSAIEPLAVPGLYSCVVPPSAG